MASNQSKLKRSFPLFFALVVLISCLPVIPAAADEIYWLDGTWRFNFDISWDSDFDFFHPSFVTIDDSSYNAFNYIYSESEIWLYNQSDEVCAYDSGEWNGPFPVVVFSERVQVTKDEYDFFQTNLTQTSSPSATYSTTLNIDGQLFNFFGTGSSPLVEMTVNIDGCTLTDGSSSRQFVYSGSGTFKGFSISSGGSLNYSIGSTWSFGGKSGVDSSYSLFSVVEDDSQPVYSSSITINGVTETFTSIGSAPKISMKVLDTGAVFTAAGKTVPYVYEGEGTFEGLSFSAIGSPSFVPGESYELAAGDHTLYPIASTVPSGAFFTTTVVIDGGKFPFPGTVEASPDVSMAVTETGATLSCGALTYHYPYTGSGEYLGLTIAGSSDIVYPVGTTATLGGADGADVLFSLVSCAASQTYTKVTQNLADWTGTYLIVYEVSETEGYVFTGVDEKLNSVLTQLADGNIVTSASDLAFCPVRFEPYGSGYSIKLLSGVNVGKYIYASPSGYNDILFSDEPQQLTISHDGTTVHILDGEAPFQFNKSSSYLWFRFFAAKPGGQSEIALYKLDDGTSGGEFVLSAGQWEANKSLASATNEYVALGDWPAGLNPVALSFISNSQSYSSISYRNTIEFGYSLFFDDTRVYGYDTLAAISDPGWQSDAYALIYFAEDQIVSSEFHAWFTSNFRRVSDDLVSPSFSTTINIYDSNGLVLQQSYKFSDAVAPKVTLTVTDTGCKLSFNGLTYTWVSLSDAFYGFNLSAHSSVAFYKLGQIYVLPGENYADLTFNLYIVDEEPLADNAQGVFSGFVSFLIAPIQAFFTIEFIPGLSFGKIALFAFVVGLLFWFLKISK